MPGITEGTLSPTLAFSLLSCISVVAGTRQMIRNYLCAHLMGSLYIRHGGKDSLPSAPPLFTGLTFPCAISVRTLRALIGLTGPDQPHGGPPPTPCCEPRF